MENIKPEIELLNTSKRGVITLSSKCKKLLKKFTSTIAEQFNPHGKDINFTIEVLPNENCKKESYYLDLKRILPLLEKVQGKLTIKLPTDKSTIITNGKSFARNLQIKELIIDGQNLEFGRYAICEADSLNKITLKGVSHLGHCAFSKNRNTKTIVLQPNKEKEITIQGQVYKPADLYDITAYDKINMEIPLLSSSPWVYADPRKCQSVKPTDWIYCDLDQYKIEKGVLELRTSPKYKINSNSKFSITVPEADSYINKKEYDSQVIDCLKSINNKTFGELLNFKGEKEVSVNDIYKACIEILANEKKAAKINEIIEAEKTVKKSKKFDWHKQQKEQDKNIEKQLTK